jgi:hypothetical protein
LPASDLFLCRLKFSFQRISEPELQLPAPEHAYRCSSLTIRPIRLIFHLAPTRGVPSPSGFGEFTAAPTLRRCGNGPASRMMENGESWQRRISLPGRQSSCAILFPIGSESCGGSSAVLTWIEAEAMPSQISGNPFHVQAPPLKRMFCVHRIPGKILFNREKCLSSPIAQVLTAPA